MTMFESCLSVNHWEDVNYARMAGVTRVNEAGQNYGTRDLKVSEIDSRAADCFISTS